MTYSHSSFAFPGMEKRNEERIRGKELEDKNIYWLEKELVPIIEELSKRTGICISEKKEGYL